MARTKVYIAGPLSRGDRITNLAQGLQAYRTLMLHGFAPFCPHFSCLMPWFMDSVTHRDWLDADLPWVAASDAILRLPGDSVGADEEVEHARSLGLPIFYDINDLLEELSPVT